jgi:Tfp pilus assembly protein PilX
MTEKEIEWEYRKTKGTVAVVILVVLFVLTIIEIF